MRDIVASIKNKLKEIEEKENVRIILAVESGSRAWGFESPDSDYDVRFIYVRRPEDYIRLNPLRDVIEWQLDDVYDVSGWDLQKALRLMRESNPSLHEWCASTIIYRDSDEADELRSLAEDYFLSKKAIYHYISMAKHNYHTYLESNEVRLKKYFYALRPVLAARWIIDRDTVPPMLFDELVSAELPEELRACMKDLITAKKNTSELGTGPKIPEFDRYITEQINLLEEAANSMKNCRNDWGRAEEYFRKAVIG